MRRTSYQWLLGGSDDFLRVGLEERHVVQLRLVSFDLILLNNEFELDDTTVTVPVNTFSLYKSAVTRKRG